MKHPKPSLWGPVVIEWMDASGTYENHNAKGFVRKYEPFIRRSIGFFLGKNKNGYFICDTDDRGLPGDHDAENITVIPLGMVREVRLLD